MAQQYRWSPKASSKEELAMMGKRTTSQSSPKRSKNEKQQFGNLIKVLRPKVYITDTSKFKSLVQELTGNGRSLSSSSSSSSSPLETRPQMMETAPLFIDIDGNDQVDETNYHHDSSSMETSGEGYVDNYNSLDNYYNHVFLGADQEVGQVDHSNNNNKNQRDIMDAFSAFDHHHMPMPMSQGGEDFNFAYRDLESWLMDTDEPYCSSYNGYYGQQNQQQQISMYDYTRYLG